MPRDHRKPFVTSFWFCENSWEPTFISFNVQKQFFGNMLLDYTYFKMKNIGVYYYLHKTSMFIIKMPEEGQFKC